MAMTNEERKAYQREYYKKNKTRIQTQQASYREKNGIETPGFIAPKDIHDDEWKSLSDKFLKDEVPREEQSGIGAFSEEWEDFEE
jgi:hypothetical protein